MLKILHSITSLHGLWKINIKNWNIMKENEILCIWIYFTCHTGNKNSADQNWSNKKDNYLYMLTIYILII